jgi:hypothetical protein
MKNPFRHQSHGDTLPPPQVPDTPAELLNPVGHSSGHAAEHAAGPHPSGRPAGHPWEHMQQDVDPDCERDPGSDLRASWHMEHAAAEEAREEGEQNPPPEA